MIVMLGEQVWPSSIFGTDQHGVDGGRMLAQRQQQQQPSYLLLMPPACSVSDVLLLCLIERYDDIMIFYRRFTQPHVRV